MRNLVVTVMIIAMTCLFSGCGGGGNSPLNYKQTAEAHLVRANQISLIPRDNGLFDLHFYEADNNFYDLIEQQRGNISIQNYTPLSTFINNLWDSHFLNETPNAILFIKGEDGNWGGIILKLYNPVHATNELIINAIWMGDTKNTQKPNINTTIEDSFVLILHNIVGVGNDGQPGSKYTVDDPDPESLIMEIQIKLAEQSSLDLETHINETQRISDVLEQLSTLSSQIALARFNQTPFSLTVDMYDLLREAGVDVTPYPKPTTSNPTIILKNQLDSLYDAIRVATDRLNVTSQEMLIKINTLLSQLNHTYEQMNQLAQEMAKSMESIIQSIR